MKQQGSYSKYRAVRTSVGGLTFASKREAARYQELLLLERGKVIKDLQTQVKFSLIVNSQKIATYIADFVYFEDGQKVTEDVKGVKTREYRLKKKLMQALYGIEIRET